MVISTGNLIAIDKVLEDILSILSYELEKCEKVEFEIKGNRKNKEILENICLEIEFNSNCIGNKKCDIEYYISRDCDDEMCEYSIKLYWIKNLPYFLQQIKYFLI